MDVTSLHLALPISLLFSSIIELCTYKITQTSQNLQKDFFLYLMVICWYTEPMFLIFNEILQLYFFGSGTGFYFVYDFCLYGNMSSGVAYFLRYLPLFVGILVCAPLVFGRYDL